MLTRAEHDNGQALDFSYTGTHVLGIRAGSDLAMVYTYTNGLLKTAACTVGTEQHVRSYEYMDGILTRRTNPGGHEYVYGYQVDGNGVLTHKGTSLSVDAEKWFEHSVIYRSDTLSDVNYKGSAPPLCLQL